jgi:uncharacterized protein
MSPLLLIVLLGSGVLGAVRIWSCRRRGMGCRRALGLSLDWRGLRDAGSGMLIAAFAMGAVFIAAVATKSVGITGVGPAAPLWSDVPGFMMVAFLEELVFRSALLGGLLVLMPSRPWAAILISAAIFGGLHLENSHATPLAALGSTLGGIAYGTAFVATRSIWLPFGLHFAWNHVQGPVLGFALSGGKPLRGTFIQQESVGAAWFTGGEYGPEAGVIGLLGRMVVLAGLLALLTRTGRMATNAAARPAGPDPAGLAVQGHPAMPRAG